MEVFGVTHLSRFEDCIYFQRHNWTRQTWLQCQRNIKSVQATFGPQKAIIRNVTVCRYLPRTFAPSSPQQLENLVVTTYFISSHVYFSMYSLSVRSCYCSSAHALQGHGQFTLEFNIDLVQTLIWTATQQNQIWAKNPNWALRPKLWT